MYIQVYCGDRFHPGITVRQGLQPFANAGVDFAWIEDAHQWNPDRLAGAPAVILSKSNQMSATNWHPWLSGARESAFRDYVRAGGGLLIVHSGCASYAQVAPMRGVTGGTFVSHPPPCEVTLEPTPRHALASGVEEPFAVLDEHYFMTVDDAEAEVFLHSRSAHGLQPAGWIRREGAGRVCVLTPGHYQPVWLHPSFQQLLRNALRWVTAG